MPKSAPRDGTYEWTAVATLSFAFGLVGLDRFVLPPLFPALMKDLDLTYQDLGAIAQNYGIQYTLYFALAGLVMGAAFSAFLKETAPRV